MSRRAGPWFAAAALALAVPLVAGPAMAEGCALELILAVDVSGSVDPGEYELQTGGLQRALRSDAVAEAVEGLDGPVFAAVTEWSGASRQALVVPWTRLAGRADLEVFATRLGATPRAFRHFSTAIGQAIIHALSVGATAPEVCRRRVIDISGDGVSNEGPDPAQVRHAAAAAGYVINGLAISGAKPDPVAHYRERVIVGPDAFVEVANGFRDYPRAILRKLLREIAPDAIVAGVR